MKPLVINIILPEIQRHFNLESLGFTYENVFEKSMESIEEARKHIITESNFVDVMLDIRKLHVINK